MNRERKKRKTNCIIFRNTSQAEKEKEVKGIKRKESKRHKDPSEPHKKRPLMQANK